MKVQLRGLLSGVLCLYSPVYLRADPTSTEDLLLRSTRVNLVALPSSDLHPLAPDALVLDLPDGIDVKYSSSAIAGQIHESKISFDDALVSNREIGLDSRIENRRLVQSEETFGHAFGRLTGADARVFCQVPPVPTRPPTTVPEPGTVTLIGSGVLCLGAYIRRRALRK